MDPAGPQGRPGSTRWPLVAHVAATWAGTGLCRLVTCWCPLCFSSNFFFFFLINKIIAFEQPSSGLICSVLHLTLGGVALALLASHYGLRL